MDIKNLIHKNLSGENIGLPSFCSSNSYVLECSLNFAAEQNIPIVIEATCNQVNQEGGYTGKTPKIFQNWLEKLANENRLPKKNLILGGDHLGPNPWKAENLETAMDKARTLVKDYVEAGFTKIHLDASMACGGEPHPSFEQVAERSAELCAVAEKYAPDPNQLLYIIGTEVPIPGGEKEEPQDLEITSEERLKDTIDTHKEAWAKKNLTQAWDRIVSVVVQPGVDFGHTNIYPFDPQQSFHLTQAIKNYEGLTYEAHSTDYQSDLALSQLISNHFFFLKVGPELTFRLREAVWALSEIANQLPNYRGPNMQEVLKVNMNSHPKYWQEYYSGTEEEIDFMKIFSFSDRIRYYWDIQEVEKGLALMISELKSIQLPKTLISQYFMIDDFGNIPNTPFDLIKTQILKCVERYSRAARLI